MRKPGNLVLLLRLFSPCSAGVWPGWGRNNLLTAGGSEIITDPDLTLANAVARAMDKSAELLLTAANDGDNESRFALGLLYLLGRGVEKNAGEAYKLFGQALDAGDAQAAHFREIAAEHLDREQIEERDSDESTRAAMKEAQRRQRFPKPKLVEPD